jgi:hypothetical protein
MFTDARAKINERMLKIILRRILQRPCPDVIPMGEKGRRLNCFHATARSADGNTRYWIKSLEGEFVKCLRWDGTSFSKETSESISALTDLELNITHWYGPNIIEFFGIWDFIWSHYTRVIYVRTKCQQIWNATAQFIFNRRSLNSQKRVNILRLLVRDRLSGNTVGLTIYDVLSKLYSDRWISHPSHDMRESEIQFHLESLRESGDASQPPNQITYIATGRSLLTLEQFDEQDRRHRETSRLQLWLVILTLILAVASIVQTELIKLPTVLDFGRQ